MNTGGPAFPYSALQPGGPTMYADSEGMTLRDYFAAKALLVSGPANKPPAYDDETRAKYAYALADEMMKAREK